MINALRVLMRGLAGYRVAGEGVEADAATAARRAMRCAEVNAAPGRKIYITITNKTWVVQVR